MSVSIDAQPQARYLCPITTEVMMDPVMDRHGHNFERSAILDWLTRSQECPLNRGHVEANDLFPNLALKEEIQEWLETNTQQPGPSVGLPRETSSPAALATSSVPSSPQCPPLQLDSASITETAGFEGDSLDTATPWVKFNISQEEYDQLTSLFCTFARDKLTMPNAHRLFRFMNYSKALANLSALFPADLCTSEEGNGVSKQEFIEFASKHRPSPAAEYSMSTGKYRRVVQLFQQLDTKRCGEVSRELLPQLCEVAGVKCEALGPLPGFSPDISCHDFLKWCQGPVQMAQPSSPKEQKERPESRPSPFRNLSRVSSHNDVIQSPPRMVASPRMPTPSSPSSPTYPQTRSNRSPAQKSARPPTTRQSSLTLSTRRSPIAGSPDRPRHSVAVPSLPPASPTTLAAPLAPPNTARPRSPNTARPMSPMHTDPSPPGSPMWPVKDRISFTPRPSCDLSPRQVKTARNTPTRSFL